MTVTEGDARTLFEQAAAIARAGQPEDGVRFIEDAAAGGDPQANFIVAHWLLYGSDRPRDAAAACRHLDRAAQSGSSEALRVLAHLTASGTGCARDRDKALTMLRQASATDSIAREEMAMLQGTPGPEEPRDVIREQVSADPHIEILRSLLTAAECGYLMARAKPLLKPSFVDDGKTGMGRPDPIRTSHGAAFVPHEEDLVVQAICQRLANASGTDVTHAEALYVMRYAPGQQYRPHLDALPGLANQREWTAIAYLNNRFEGGATVFPQLGLSIRGEVGDVLLYRNVTSSGEADRRMMHAGEPVASGEKWIATRWIRQGPHDPYDRG